MPTAHRERPGPWVMRMTWHDVLFAHWRLDPAELQPHVPDRLTIETYDGSAWLGVVPFYMTGVRARCMPPIPTASAFAEINVRTYVTDGAHRGVWFFSLDAESRLAVRAARWSFGLNYHHARMSHQPADRDADGWIASRSARVGADAVFQARYRPVGDVFQAAPDSLEAFLTDRYCLFAADRRGRVRRGDVAHPPWPLQRAEAEIPRNSMTRPLNICLPGDPHLLFAQGVSVHAYAPVPVN